MDEIPSDSKPQPPAKPAETPDLFGPGELPERPDLVQMVKRGVHRFTAERLSRDEELCRSVCADLLLGLSARAIARKWHISRSSVGSIEALMRANGEMDSIRMRTLDLLGKVTITGLEVWLHALENGLISPGQIPIPVLAALDKKAQLEAGVVLGTGRTEKELSVDDLEAAWSKVKSAGAVIDVESQPIDSPSTWKPAEPQQIQQFSPSAGTLEGPFGVGGWSKPAQPEPLPAVPTPTTEADRHQASRDEGGGVPPARPGGAENERGSVGRD